ncbi:MAG: CIC family chloride channel protein [Flavobacteriales bacterium]|jgi:CIC family chloride channel protein
MTLKVWLKKFLLWRVKHISNRQFILILSVIVGFGSGLAAVVIKNMTHFIQALLISDSIKDYHTYLYFLYPLIGIALTVLVIKYIIRKPVGHGIPGALYAISKRNGIIPRNNMFRSIFTSALTVGFGGSVGLEGPTVATGSAIGSNVARLMRLNYKTRILLIGCAAAGTLSAIFEAPVAAIVFALEVLMLDLTMSSMVPLLMASVAAGLTSRMLVGEDVLFYFKLSDSFQIADTGYYVILGIAGGLLSVYVTKVFFFVEELFKKIKARGKRVIIGGSVLGLLVFVLPPLYGEGYESINHLLSGNASLMLEGTWMDSFAENAMVLLLIIVAMFMFKIIATAVTFAAGGVGGIFAPTLFMGSMMGYAVASTINIFSKQNVSVSNFTLVGMGALMAGVLHAPLTAIFLIAELTGGYELFLPLMIAASISYMTVKYFVPHSIYNKQLADRGELITHHKDKAVLMRLQLSKVIERNFKSIYSEMTLGELVKVVAHSTRNIFPVVSHENELQGIVTLDDIRNIMFDQSLYEKIKVEDLMHQPLGIIDCEEPMEQVMDKFKKSGAWNLAVTKRGKYDGFVSKAKLFSVYRGMLVEFSED